MVREQIMCMRCTKVFWRNKLKKGQKETLGDSLCQMCKNTIRHEIHKSKIKVLEDPTYYNILKLSIDKLVKLEKVKPGLLEQIRGKKVKGKNEMGK